jgi:hypothetical protein
MQTATVNFDDGNQQMSSDYVNEAKWIVKQQIREAFQTLCEQEGKKGEWASQLRRQAIDDIITSLKDWEQINAWLTSATSEIRPEIPVGTSRFALKTATENEAESISGKISTIGNQLNIYDTSRDISERTSHSELIRSFTTTINETAHSIYELLYMRINSSIEVTGSTDWST